MKSRLRTYDLAGREAWRRTSQTIFGTNDWIPPQGLMRAPKSCDEEWAADPDHAVKKILYESYRRKLGALSVAVRETV